MGRFALQREMFAQAQQCARHPSRRLRAHGIYGKRGQTGYIAPPDGDGTDIKCNLFMFVFSFLFELPTKKVGCIITRITYFVNR